ncbi:hypothetical protein DAI22_03g407700 [Oryza sativa Japonica Group]|nr:hypothetical protein DAI22_03g407700 [Oryza sativa Japonica Group]
MALRAFSPYSFAFLLSPACSPPSISAITARATSPRVTGDRHGLVAEQQHGRRHADAEHVDDEPLVQELVGEVRPRHDQHAMGDGL